jgi:hypothetical protein
MSAWPRPLRNPIVAAGLVSAAATAAIVLVPVLRFAYRAPELHVALETSAALIGLLAAYLVFGRFRRSAQLDDLLLCFSLGLLASSNLVFAALPAVLNDGPDRFGTWSRLFGQLVGTTILAVAAVAPRRRVRLTRAEGVAAALLLPLVLTGVAAVVAYLGSRLPNGVELIPTAEGSKRPRLEGHAALLTAQLGGAGLYLFAAIGFGRKARAAGDELMPSSGRSRD